MFQKHIDKTHKWTDREVKNWHDAEALVISSNLAPLIELSTREWIYRGHEIGDKDVGHPDWPNKEQTFSNTIILHLHIPFDKKDIVRDLFFELEYEAGKTYGIDSKAWPRKDDYYLETWTWKKNVNKNRWCTNTIAIVFYRPVKEGDIVNGCAVKKVKHESIHSYLAIVCDKDG